jgi:hypothetical protein
MRGPQVKFNVELKSHALAASILGTWIKRENRQQGERRNALIIRKSVIKRRVVGGFILISNQSDGYGGVREWKKRAEYVQKVLNSKLIQSFSHSLILYWDSCFLFVQSFFSSIHEPRYKIVSGRGFEPNSGFKTLWTYSAPMKKEGEYITQRRAMEITMGINNKEKRKGSRLFESWTQCRMIQKDL